MYASTYPGGLGALPGWLSAIGNKVVRGTTVTIPGPGGTPIVFDLGDPQGMARARAALSGARIQTSLSNRPPSMLEQLNQDVREQVPGGWATVGVGVLGLLWLAKAMR